MSDIALSVHPAVQMGSRIVAGLVVKTCRSLEQWVELVRAEGRESEKEWVAWPRSDYGLGTNHARLLDPSSIAVGLAIQNR